MKSNPSRLFILLMLCTITGCLALDQTPTPPQAKAEDITRLRELDAYWAAVSRAVAEGDFETYKATCHEQGVLVAGIKKNTQPLAKALARWKQEFDATKAGKMKASVTFRFASRIGDADTAHETGIFLYTQTAEGKSVEEYIHFEAVLIKQEGKWLILMEYQKAKATKEEWEGLK